MLIDHKLQISMCFGRLQLPIAAIGCRCCCISYVVYGDVHWVLLDHADVSETFASFLTLSCCSLLIQARAEVQQIRRLMLLLWREHGRDRGSGDGWLVVDLLLHIRCHANGCLERPVVLS